MTKIVKDVSDILQTLLSIRVCYTQPYCDPYTIAEWVARAHRPSLGVACKTLNKDSSDVDLEEAMLWAITTAMDRGVEIVSSGTDWYGSLNKRLFALNNAVLMWESDRAIPT